MYQVASAGLEPDSIAYPIRKIINSKENVFFRMAEVKSIDPDGQIITTSIGTLSYDKVIIATGATNNFFGNKGV